MTWSLVHCSATLKGGSLRAACHLQRPTPRVGTHGTAACAGVRRCSGPTADPLAAHAPSGLLPFGGVGKSGNWHPAGSEGPRLSTYAVAVMSVPYGQLTSNPALDRQLARDPLKRLERQHRAEEVCERFGCWLSIEAEVASLSWSQLKVRGGR